MLNHRNEALGIYCPNFQLCPICYGCRNMHPDDSACAKCKQQDPNNICNVRKHKPQTIGKFVTQQVVKLEEI